MNQGVQSQVDMVKFKIRSNLIIIMLNYEYCQEEDGMSKEKKIKLKNLIAYGVGDLYGGGSFFIVGTLFMIFLTDVAGLSPFKAGLVFIVGKIWDAISDPLMGYISDNTETSLGRRRVYFLIGMLPVGISFAMMWYPVDFLNQNFTFLYYVMAYIFFCTVFTMLMVPYSALNAEMTFDYKERTRLNGARMIFSQGSTLIAGVVPKIVIDNFATPGKGYFVMGLIFGILYTLPWIFVYLGTWELETGQQKEKPSFIDFLKNFKTVFINRSFRIQLGMYLAAYSAMDIIMAVFAYYITYYVNRPDLFQYCLGALVIAQLLGLPLYVKLCNRKGGGKTYILGLSIWGVAMFFVSFLESTTPGILIILNCIMIGAGLSSGVLVPYAILPMVIDVDEMITAKRRAGVYAGMMTFIRKTIQALVLFLVGIALETIGYVPNAQQTADTLFKMKILFVFLPLALIIIGIIVALKLRITPYTHAVLLDEMQRLKQGGDHEKVAASAEEICEEMTGLEYSELYGAGLE